jgi:predicted SAM-dependent methyltransferase
LRKKLRRVIRRALASHFGVNHDQGLITQYLDNSTTEKKLQLGCGRNWLEGWLNSDYFPRNSDILQLDVTVALPFENDTFDYIFSEHVIEHISYPEGAYMLEECFRVLKPGGVLRVGTPDLAFLVNLYREDEAASQSRTQLEQEFLEYFLANEIKDRETNAPVDFDTYLINKFVRAWGHEFIYDEKSLRHMMKTLCFAEITRCEVMESAHQALCGLENIDRKPPGHIALETIVMESTKPAG